MYLSNISYYTSTRVRGASAVNENMTWQVSTTSEKLPYSPGIPRTPQGYPQMPSVYLGCPGCPGSHGSQKPTPKSSGTSKLSWETQAPLVKTRASLDCFGLPWAALGCFQLPSVALGSFELVSVALSCPGWLWTAFSCPQLALGCPGLFIKSQKIINYFQPLIFVTLLTLFSIVM